jgi:hypothetical protein
MWTAILFTLTLSATAPAGVRLEWDTVDPKGVSRDQRVEVQGNKVRIDLLGKESNGIGGVSHIPRDTIIFDGTEVLVIDHRNKTYTVTVPAQLRARLEWVKSTLPPDARTQLERATFKKGSGGDKVAGYSCSNYAALRDGIERATLCVATWKAVPVKKDDLVGLMKFADTLADAMATKGTMRKSSDEVPGFSVSSLSSEGDSWRLKSAARTPIADNEFQPASDYTRQAVPALGDGQ